ncbi:hypothetical protein AYI69_g437 [Smittium culicis]|uniref:Uncharacterized protein n=1 Tax=Smittium culicis TaxID=133412 RepID=A0A1R1YT04_9FUNG|nr:hypothetical protein AYI69_g437 [Smittium culicis]
MSTVYSSLRSPTPASIQTPHSSCLCLLHYPPSYLMKSLVDYTPQPAEKQSMASSSFRQPPYPLLRALNFTTVLWRCPKYRRIKMSVWNHRPCNHPLPCNHEQRKPTHHSTNNK